LGAVPAGQDQRFYDLCNVQVVTQGQANSTGTIGELWFTYEIALHKPIFAVGQGLNLLTDKYQLASCSSTGNAWFGTSPKLVQGSLLGTSLTTVSGTGVSIVFPNYIVQGTYLVMMTYYGSSGGSIPELTWSLTGNNCTFQQVWSSNGGADMISYQSLSVINTTTTAQQSFLVFMITVNAPGELVASVAMNSAATMTASGTYGDLLITQVNGNIST